MIGHPKYLGWRYSLNVRWEPEQLNSGHGVANHVEDDVGENQDEDIKKTIMDPNTRMLVRVNITDLQNDMEIFQILRSSSKNYRLERKLLIQDFKVDRDMIDT